MGGREEGEGRGDKGGAGERTEESGERIEKLEESGGAR